MRAASMLGWALKSKSVEAPGGGEVREAHPPREAAGLGGVDFCGEELLKELGVGLACGCGLVQRGGQRFGGGGELGGRRGGI